MESKYHIQQNELEETAMNLPVLHELDGKYVLVTGATGLVGTQIAKTLLCYNRLFHKSIKVIVCGRDRKKIEEVYNCLPVFKIIADVTKPISTDYPIDYIIHCANVTSSQFFVNNPVETISVAICGTANLLELAREKKVAGFLFTSSLEVYGVPSTRHVTETDYGYIDFLNVRSSYSEGKRMAECICSAYTSQYGVPCKIVRLTQTIGSGINYEDNRVFAQFAKCVIEKKDIVLNTPGKTVRSYCDITDAVRGIITVLLKGNAGEAYNIANKDTVISIAEMAQFICERYSETGIKIVYNKPNDLNNYGYNPEMEVCLNPQKIENLGWKAEIGLDEMFKKLIDGLKEKKR